MEAVIDVDKIRENAAKVRSMAAGKELTLMLKADAYNHGADVVAAATQEFADAFGVAVPEEARRLKAVNGFTHGITVYSPLPREIPAVVAEGFVPVIYSAECLEALRYSGGAEVDIKFDTGMGRLGFKGEEGVREAAFAARRSRLKIGKLLTHLPSAASASECVALFNDYKRVFEEAFGESFPAEYSASDALIEGLSGDGYRIGRLLYEGAMKIYSEVLAVSFLKKGEHAGYDGVYTAPDDIAVAVLQGGYYDGVRRDFRGGKVVFNNRMMTIAAVCMDVTIVAGAPAELRQGDKVCLFDGGIDAGDANIYEQWTSFKGRTERKYLLHGKILTEENCLGALRPCFRQGRGIA